MISHPVVPSARPNQLTLIKRIEVAMVDSAVHNRAIAATDKTKRPIAPGSLSAAAGSKSDAGHPK